MATRTFLSRVIYTRTYDSLNGFLSEFSSLNLEQGEAVQNLRTTVTSFDSLLKLFEHQTRSPGVKACYDLKVFSLDCTF